MRKVKMRIILIKIQMPYALSKSAYFICIGVLYLSAFVSGNLCISLAVSNAILKAVMIASSALFKSSDVVDIFRSLFFETASLQYISTGFAVISVKRVYRLNNICRKKKSTNVYNVVIVR